MTECGNVEMVRSENVEMITTDNLYTSHSRFHTAPTARISTSLAFPHFHI